MGTRWYAAGLGRFTARDVIFGELTSPMTLNQHVYGGLNPATMWDPTGMGQCTMAGECVTTTASGGVQAVGGNPGAANHPMHNSGSRVHAGSSIDAGRAVDVTPRPPRPDPMIRDADFVSDIRAVDLSTNDSPTACGTGPCSRKTRASDDGGEGCGVLWLGCAWGGIKAAGRWTGTGVKAAGGWIAENKWAIAAWIAVGALRCLHWASCARMWAKGRGKPLPRPGGRIDSEGSSTSWSG
jgi:hypothetical protein